MQVPPFCHLGAAVQFERVVLPDLCSLSTALAPGSCHWLAFGGTWWKAPGVLQAPCLCFTGNTLRFIYYSRVSGLERASSLVRKLYLANFDSSSTREDVRRPRRAAAGTVHTVWPLALAFSGLCGGSVPRKCPELVQIRKQDQDVSSVPTMGTLRNLGRVAHAY